MPLIFQIGRLKFYIYPMDHWPPHVHVKAPDAEGKFEIKTGKCLAAYGFSKRTINRISDMILIKSKTLFQIWEKYDGQT